MTSYFLTGTDTDVGKTLVATALLHKAQSEGLTTVGLKPVAAGAELTKEGLRNEDALALQAVSSVKLHYEQVNPYCFEPAIAPHIAAAEAGTRLTVARLEGFCRGVLLQKPDFCVIEGAGGWRVPLNNRETLADLAKSLQLPVILVVGMRLGCINHALLTAQAIQQDGLRLTGWVANTCEMSVMPRYQDNLDTLKSLLAAPLLGEIPFLVSRNIKEAAGYLSLPGREQ
jgi:dethiobiotin synthetase